MCKKQKKVIQNSRLNELNWNNSNNNILLHIFGVDFLEIQPEIAGKKLSFLY